MENVLASAEFQMSLLMFVAMLGYFLARRIGQSVVVGEILVGVLVGPSVLGWITYTDFVKTLATMGAIVLLFVVGLSVNYRDLFNQRSIFVALFGVLLPWVGGFAVAEWFGYGLAEAVFVGTALTATSIAITVAVLKEMDKLDSAAAKVIIGAAVVDDVLALFALSLTKEFLAGHVVLTSFAYSAITAVLFLLFGLLVGVFVLKHFLESWDKWATEQGIGQSTFIAAIAIAFFYATVAELVGLSAIIGAFLAGLCLESVQVRSYREGTQYLEYVFSAIFFVSLGVLVDVNAFSTMMLWFLLALTVVAILTKFVGCFFPARLFKLSGLDASIVGVGMVPRGEIMFIMALYGLTAGLIGQALYSTLLLVSLLTTIATPVLLKRFYESKRLQWLAQRA